MKTLRRKLQSALSLATIAVIAIAAPASAAGTENLAGTYNGSYTGTTDTRAGLPFVVGTTVAGTVTFTSQAKGKAAKVKIQGPKFTAHILFRKNGTAHTDAIVPGVANKMGDGTWSISANQKIITYKLTSSEPITISIVSFPTGKLTAHGKMEIAGPSNKFSIKGKAKGTSNLGPIKAHYKFK